MYRRPCLWSYENNVSSGVARGGWVLNDEDFMWRVCNFEWNDQLRGYISAELPRAKLDGLEKIEYYLKSREDGGNFNFYVILYFVYL